MNYFKHLPLISYNGRLATNIMSRARISDESKGRPSLFYPYTLEDGDRADNVANAYYDSPAYTWLVWLSNETVDPYFDLGVSDQDLLQIIADKYGSLERAQRRVVFYRTNGLTDSTTITPTQFAALPFQRQKYWSPVLDYMLNVREYVRNKDPQTINTNRIVSLSVTDVNGKFIVGEEVQRNGTNYGFATAVDSSTVIIEHVFGSFPEDSIITGVDSGATATVVDDNTIITTLAADDAQYWEPVNAFDYELELNQKKRDIVLVGNQNKRDIEEELRRTLNTL